MNYRMILHTTGNVVKFQALLMVLPIITSLIYGEYTALIAFAITAGIALIVGFAMCLFKPQNQVIYSKEGLVTVAITWVVVSVIGALPFVISGEIPNFIDALFESVSGFTTTGATILPGEIIEGLSHGMLFWRSFTHWIGGMGIIVFVIALANNPTDRSMHILRAEMPGPTVDKLVPRAKDTAIILYIMYVVVTVVEIIMLWCGGMQLFDSIVLSFGTAGTGGFAVLGDSIASYSAYSKWVIAVFMVLFGVNFNLYYLMFKRKFRSAFSSRELWVYLGIVLVSTGIITVNIYNLFGNFGDSVRESFFQVASYMTTTGYGTTDANAWPTLSKAILLTLMFIGGCAGSTAGGLKVSRVMILFKNIGGELKRVLHPNTAVVIKQEGKRVEDSKLAEIGVYFALYFVVIIGTFVLLSFDDFGLEANFSASVSCVNNIGPFFSAVTDVSSYAAYSYFSKVVMTVAMLLGRLELYPLLLALIPSTWMKK